MANQQICHYCGKTAEDHQIEISETGQPIVMSGDRACSQWREEILAIHERIARGQSLAKGLAMRAAILRRRGIYAGGSYLIGWRVNVLAEIDSDRKILDWYTEWAYKV